MGVFRRVWRVCVSLLFFFFNETAPTEIYTLSLHDALPSSRMAAMQQALKFFAPDLPVLVFPAWDCLPYDRISPNAEVSARRMATLAILADGYEFPSVILATLNAATQKIPERKVVASSSFTAVVGTQINVENLRAYLVRMGYNQAPTRSEERRVGKECRSRWSPYH